MALLGSAITSEVGLRLLLSPLGSNVVIKTACCTIGAALPVYSTFKSIETNDRNEQDKWLLYWAVYGSFSIVEVFSDKILSCFVINAPWRSNSSIGVGTVRFPLYYHVKFAFLVWLQLPSGNGSRHLYSRHLRPFLLRHQAKVDQLLDFTSREIVKFASAHQGEIQFFMALLKRCAVTANQVVKDFVQPVQSRGLNAIEDSNAVARRESPDSESDHDD